MRRTLLAITLTSVVAACGTTTATTSGADTPTTAVAVTTATPSPPTSESTPASTTTTVDDDADLPRIKVEDGVKAEGLDTLSVRVGETVRFEVEADVADEVHVHGYDLSFETIPNQEVLVEFVADVPGIFEVELEGLRLAILDIEVTP